jgi:phosphatidylglycerol:prolipoprotein diacylglycerol transferase
LYPVIYDFGLFDIYPFFVVLGIAFLFVMSIVFGIGEQKKLTVITRIVFSILGTLILAVPLYFIYPAFTQGANPLAHTVRQEIRIYSYGLMLVIAFITAWILLIRHGRARGIDPDTITDLLTVVIIGGIIGAKVFFVILNGAGGAGPDTFMHRVAYIFTRDAWKIWEGGLSIHGAVVGGVVAGYIMTRAKRLNALDMLDLFAPVLLLGQAIGRVGCFLNGCCWGVEAQHGGLIEHTIGVEFPEDKQTALGRSAIEGIRHPVQLYEAFFNFAGFLYLLRVTSKAVFKGHVWLVYGFLYSFIRFWIDMFRFDESAKVLFNALTYAQLASLVIMVVFGLLIVIGRRNAKLRELEAESEDE